MTDKLGIDKVMEYVDKGYIPIKDGEILLLQDIVRDTKNPFTPYSDYKTSRTNRAFHKEIDSVLIEELLDYQENIDPDKLKRLNDKKRLFIPNNKHNKSYKQRF